MVESPRAADDRASLFSRTTLLGVALGACVVTLFATWLFGGQEGGPTRFWPPRCLPWRRFCLWVRSSGTVFGGGCDRS